MCILSHPVGPEWMSTVPESSLFAYVICSFFTILDIQQYQNTWILCNLCASKASLCLKGTHHFEPCHEKTCLQGFATKNDSNRPAQPQKLARVLKILNLASIGIILSRQQTPKALVRLMLISTFVVRKWHKAGFLMTWLFHICKFLMSHLMTKPTQWLCPQQRLRSAWASAQSDQSLHCPVWSVFAVRSMGS